MTPPTPTSQHHNLTWCRSDLAVLVVLAFAAGAALAVRAANRPRHLGPEPRGMPQRAAEAAERINPNLAPPDSLRRLPRIGPVLAGAIVAAREPRAGGPFKDLDDLRHRVRGIGPVTARIIAPLVTFDPADP